MYQAFMATLLIILISGDSAWAAGPNEEIIKPSSGGEVKGGWVKEKNFTFVEKQKTCRAYEGKYISYYDKVYVVEYCKRREIFGQQTLLEIGKEGKSIQVVNGDVIAQLEAGPQKVSIKKSRSCKQLESLIVSLNFMDIYLVEKCRKRLFPDWATLESYQKKRGAFVEPIEVVSDREFAKLKLGRDMPSILDEEFKKLLQGDVDVDLIPADEACQGLEGKDVSFYSRLYKIESCRKREYNVEALMRQKNGQLTYRKLTDQQWMSLPDGSPMPTP